MNHPLLLLLSNPLSLHTRVSSFCVLFVPLCCFAVLIHDCHNVKFGHFVPSLQLLLTCLILLVCVCVSLLGACVAGPGAERGEFGTPA